MGTYPRWIWTRAHSGLLQACSGKSGSIETREIADSQTPLTIDSFELLKVIGKGSFGKVRTLGPAPGVGLTTR